MDVADQQDGLRILRLEGPGLRAEMLKAVQQQVVTSVQVRIDFLSGKGLLFGYETPDGNRPKTNGNAVHLWPVSANSVPFGVTSQIGTKIAGDTPSGDQSIESGISLGAYVLGYAVGPEDPGNTWSPYVDVVASAYIPAATTLDTAADRRTSSIRTCFVGQNTLAFHYTFLAGFNPEAAKSWVGLWEGNVSPYTAPPRWFSQITFASSSSDAFLGGLQLAEGATYTLALFSSGFSEKKAELQLQRLASMVVFERTA